MKDIIKIFIPFIGRCEKIRFLVGVQSTAAEKKLYILMKIINALIYKKFNCDISPYASIGKNITFPHPIGIVIGEGVHIGNNVTIYQNVTIGRVKEEIPVYPFIEDNVTVYSNSIIIGGCVVKRGCTIGAHSLVASDTREDSAWVGIPARCVKDYKRKNIEYE
ncbi:hypothetical protein CEF21_21540 [Bacillus sp. FJAT-42376]|uniref:serine O-acetyltransferase n=1 Tax=Bacillus sp. FJAT-42376 TaxID=2014076 RepID=UPI000F50D198|nr:DapH/DapD/GlmU-related protein [Bacillus sp. FJAT-42376]AZB44664.1 hypothetical protein CEF21_21540 [Bacillus sp. FJAT-42376]